MEHYLYEEFTHDGIKSYEYKSFDKMYKGHADAFHLEEQFMENYPELFPISSSEFYNNFSTMVTCSFLTSRVTITNLTNYKNYQTILCKQCKRPLDPNHSYECLCEYCASEPIKRFSEALDEEDKYNTISIKKMDEIAKETLTETQYKFLKSMFARLFK